MVPFYCLLKPIYYAFINLITKTREFVAINSSQAAKQSLSHSNTSFFSLIFTESLSLLAN